MNIRQYIQRKLSRWFDVSDADLLDVSVCWSISLDDEYGHENKTLVGKAMCSMLEEYILAPRRTSVSEGGFSFSTDYSDVIRYYMLMCRTYGVEPAKEVISKVGTISDASDLW